jgi:hypothetical protein
MKTLFATNETRNFDSFTFEVLSSEDLLQVKGGKSQDSYAELD